MDLLDVADWLALLNGQRRPGGIVDANKVSPIGGILDLKGLGSEA